MKKNEIDDGYYLELMDRLWVQTCIIEDHLYGHPLVKKIKKVRKLIEKAGLSLSEAYQIVGQHEFNLNDEKKNPIKKVILRRHKKPKK